MDFRDSLNKTMTHYKINNTELGELAGIAPREISLYRRSKKGINDRTLYRLFSALPSEARAYCVALMLIEEDNEQDNGERTNGNNWQTTKKSADKAHA